MTKEKISKHKKPWEIGAEIIKTFRMVIANFKIYPAGSKILETSLNNLHNLLAENLKSNETLTIAQTPEKLLFQGEELFETGELSKTTLTEFWQLLAKHNIQSITIKNGIEEKEVLSLVKSITSRKIAKDDFIKLFNEKENSHLFVDQTVYVPLLKGKTIINKVSCLLEGTEGQEIGGVLKTLHEAYEMMDQIPQQNAKDEVQKQLAAKLTTLNPSVLKEIFERQLPYKIEQSGLKNTLLSALSKDKITEIFNEISTWYQEISRGNPSDFKSIEQLNSLKTFLSKILTSPASKEVSFKIYEQLLKTGLLEKIPPGIKVIKDEKEALLFHVDELLAKESVILLESPTYQELPAMIKKLCELGLDDFTKSLTKKLIENSENSSTLIRLSNIRLIAKIFEPLTLNNKEEILTILQENLLQRLEKEFNLDVYRHITEVLRKRINQLFIKGEDHTFLKIIKKFKENRLLCQEKKKVEIITELMENIAFDSKKILIDDLKSENTKKHEICIQIISGLGNACTNLLIEAIKEIDDLRIRKRLTRALKAIGNEAVILLKNEINPGLSTASLKRILEVLDEFEEDFFLEPLERFIEFPDSLIKKYIISFLSKIDTKGAKDILVRFLDDPDISIQHEAIGALGKLKSKEAVDKLIKLLKVDDISLQEEICLALGEIGDEKALSILGKLLKKRRDFFGLQKETDERLRLRVVWSLRNFSNNDAKEILSETIKIDKSNLVRQIAAESLEIIEKKSHL